MIRASLRDIAEASLHDPKKALLDALGDLSQVKLFHNQVMIAHYITPPKIIKGPLGEDVIFHRTDKSHEEDRFQGKAGLVVKVGPLAFKDDAINGAFFAGDSVQEGDWVFFRTADGMEMFLSSNKTGGVSCRVFNDRDIKGRVPDPAMLW